MRTLKDLNRMILAREIYKIEKKIRDAITNRQNFVTIEGFYNNPNMDDILNELLAAKYDYSSSTDKEGFPDGKDLIIKCI